jgi:hypothetical protein
VPPDRARRGSATPVKSGLSPGLPAELPGNPVDRRLTNAEALGRDGHGRIEIGVAELHSRKRRRIERLPGGHECLPVKRASGPAIALAGLGCRCPLPLASGVIGKGRRREGRCRGAIRQRGFCLPDQRDEVKDYFHSSRSTPARGRSRPRHELSSARPPTGERLGRDDPPQYFSKVQQIWPRGG